MSRVIRNQFAVQEHHRPGVHNHLDVCVREPIMDPVLDGCVRESLPPTALEDAMAISGEFVCVRER